MTSSSRYHQISLLLRRETAQTLPVAALVPEVARIEIDHGEEGVDALPVLLNRPIRGPVRPESVALVRSAQPVVGGAAISGSANGEPLPSTSRVNNTGPGLPSVPRYTTGTGGRWPSPLGLLSTRASIHGRRLRVHRTRARLTLKFTDNLHIDRCI